jgi:2-desacetyl-2-hydroxyethyl bacteriochlorophyllide A dehydrogenase
MLALQKVEAGFGLSLVDIDPPGAPGPGEVLVEILATGICGSDLSIESWGTGYSSFMGEALPVTLGHETVGTVVALGEDVTRPALGKPVVINPAVACGRCARCKIGDAVGCTDRQAIGMIRNGAFARFVIAPAAYCYELPASIPVELGALVEPLSVGAHALVTGGMANDKRVVVFGPGPIGQGVAAMARAMGARDVTIVGLNDGARFEVLRSMGFDRLVDMADEDSEAKLAELAGHGFDLAVEAAGVPVVVDQALTVLASEGILVLAGMGACAATFDMLRMVRMRLQIRGASRIPPSAWAIVLDAMAAHPDHFAPLITHRMKLSEAAAALVLCRQRQASKVLLFPE